MCTTPQTKYKLKFANKGKSLSADLRSSRVPGGSFWPLPVVAALGRSGFGGLLVPKKAEKAAAARPLRWVRLWRWLLGFLHLRLLLLLLLSLQILLQILLLSLLLLLLQVLLLLLLSLLLNESDSRRIRSGSLVNLVVRVCKRVRRVPCKPASSAVGSGLPVRHSSPTPRQR